MDFYIAQYAQGLHDALQIRADLVLLTLQLPRGAHPYDLTWYAAGNRSMLILARAKDTDRVIGAGEIHILHTTREKKALIENVVTDHTWRRRGVATAVISSLVSWARIKDARKVMVARSPEPNVGSLCAKAGFVEEDGFLVCYPAKASP